MHNPHKQQNVHIMTKNLTKDREEIIVYCVLKEESFIKSSSFSGLSKSFK